VRRRTREDTIVERIEDTFDEQSEDAFGERIENTIVERRENTIVERSKNTFGERSENTFVEETEGMIHRACQRTYQKRSTSGARTQLFDDTVVGMTMGRGREGKKEISRPAS
jgi:hypothetical protein